MNKITSYKDLEDALAKANKTISMLCENLECAAKFAPDGLKQAYLQYVKEVKDEA